MQWRPGPGAGFTTGRPWLRLASDADARNVAIQREDPESVLLTYRRLLAFRRSAPALRTGAMERIVSGDPDVLAWTRSCEGQTLLVFVNFVGQARRVTVRGPVPGSWVARVGTHRDLPSVADDGALDLRADEAVILEAVDT